MESFSGILAIASGEECKTDGGCKGIFLLGYGGPGSLGWGIWLMCLLSAACLAAIHQILANGSLQKLRERYKSCCCILYPASHIFVLVLPRQNSERSVVTWKINGIF